jgi:hypothetical protein
MFNYSPNVFKKKTVSEQLFPSLYAQPQAPKTTSYPSSTPKPVVAPKQYPPLKGNYTSTPQPATTTPKFKPITQVTPKPTPQPTQPNPFAGFQAIADQQIKSRQAGLDQKQANIKKSFGLANEALDSQIPEYENAFNQFKTNSEMGVKDIQASGDRQKQQTRDYFGEAQKLSAQTRNQNRAQTGRTFANLGTVDSRGEGSFQQATENIDSEFNSETAKRLNEQANKLTEIDAVVGKAERDSIQAIQAEEIKKNSLIKQIRVARQQNDIEMENSLIDAYNEADDYINQIKSGIEQLKMASEQEKTRLDQESKAFEEQFKNLSPNFMKTGVPKTMADFMFRTKNPDIYEKIGSGSNDGKKTEKQMAYEAAATIAGNALTKLQSGNVKSGIGNTALGKLGETWGFNSQEQQSYRSDIAAMRTAVQNALLGANMSPKEMEQIMAGIPQYSDSPSIAEEKLRGLMRNLPLLAGNGQSALGIGQSSGGNIVTAPDGTQIMIVD